MPLGRSGRRASRGAEAPCATHHGTAYMHKRFVEASAILLLITGCGGGVGEDSSDVREGSVQLGTALSSLSADGECRGQYVVETQTVFCGYAQCPRGCTYDSFSGSCRFDNFASCGFPQCSPCLDAGGGVCLREEEVRASCSGFSEGVCRGVSGCRWQEYVCTPGGTFCSGSNVRQCNAAGTGSSQKQSCKFGCASGRCNQPPPTPSSCSTDADCGHREYICQHGDCCEPEDDGTCI